MLTSGSLRTVIAAGSVPYTTAAEACSLLTTQLERFLALVESLGTEDWTRSTACALWNVQDILAHQAGGYASGTSYREMIRQYSRIPKRDQLLEDAINELQIRERAHRSPQELMGELRRVGPVAIHNWSYKFRFAKLIFFPHPVAGFISLRYLMWVIHSRDTWMHRLDICRAAGRHFEQTPEQDGRITALIMRDVAIALGQKLAGKAVVFDLSGIAGGAWKIGAGEPSATIQMDALDFDIFASGRFSFAEACSRASIFGDVELAHHALRNILILF